MPPPLLTIPSPQDVHIWQWALDTGEVDRHWPILSLEERERADRFRFERHRRRFIMARGELRGILGRYLAVPPDMIAFDHGPEGKPFCSTQPSGWTLHFNLSHSEDRAALAVSNGFEVGIDIEHVRSLEEDIVRQVFSADEQASFGAFAPAQRQSVFFENWTRKEACLKALGTGFALPPTHFEFDLASRGDTIPRLVSGDAEEAERWRIRALPHRSGCAGAVAARRIGWSIIEMN